MPDTDHRPNVPDLPPEDKMGFAVPKTPAHSLMLLNRYMGLRGHFYINTR